MPVTTRVAPVEVMPALAISTYNPMSLFQQVCPKLWGEVWEGGKGALIDSSFPEVITIRATRHFGSTEESANGFVGTILDAYRMHNHIVLRPEDVWFAILIQFSFYVNNHAEQLREHFVDHTGKRKLTAKLDDMNIPAFASQMAGLIHANIKDAEFRDWIMPNFTTTDQNDKITASIIMMGTMQKYFAYFMNLVCGIPSVTLLGEESDWQDILERIDYLSTFEEHHPELAMWKSALETIIGYMVQTFKSPDSPDVVRFWQRAVHSYEADYAGSKMITGWVLAFCFWDTDGKLLAGPSSRSRSEEMVAKHGSDWWFDREALGSLGWDDVPSAYVHVPIHIQYYGHKFVAKAVAGSVGYTVRDSDQIFQSTRHGDNGGSDSKALVQATSKNSSEKEDFSEKLFRSPVGGKANGKELPESSTILQQDYIRSAEQQALGNAKARVPQISDLSELSEPWVYEKGGKNDTLQPVTGWWVIRINEWPYGRDPDVPDVQFDDDEDDFDSDLAYNGRPLREREEL